MKRLIIILAAISVAACSSGGGSGSNTQKNDPVSGPTLAPNDPNAPADPSTPADPNQGQQPAPPAACAAMPILGQWTKMADAQGNLDTTDVVQFNDDCSAFETACNYSFNYVAPPDASWSQYSVTQGAFSISNATARTATPACNGNNSHLIQTPVCQYVKVDSTHYYISCDFSGLREYVKTN